jgi:hypothetical protein
MLMVCTKQRTGQGGFSAGQFLGSFGALAPGTVFSAVFRALIVVIVSVVAVVAAVVVIVVKRPHAPFLPLPHSLRPAR